MLLVLLQSSNSINWGETDYGIEECTNNDDSPHNKHTVIMACEQECCNTFTKEVATRHCAPGGTPAFGVNFRFLEGGPVQTDVSRYCLVCDRFRFTFKQVSSLVVL